MTNSSRKIAPAGRNLPVLDKPPELTSTTRHKARLVIAGRAIEWGWTENELKQVLAMLGLDRRRRVPIDVRPLTSAGCGCVCGLHEQEGTGSVCLGLHQQTVTLHGGAVPRRDIPMCDPCAHWWRTTKPHRVRP